MNNLLFITFTINLLLNLIIFILFELKKPSVKIILPLVVIVSSASLSRIVFGFIPQVQPVTALVIISGSSFGPIFGFMAGSLSALVSNMFFGQGSYTVFQMSAWGIIGLISGFLGYLFKKGILMYEKIIIYAFGFLSAMLFSIITDVHTISYLNKGISIESASAVFITGMAFNISHGIFNVVILVFLYESLKKKMLRIQNK